MPSEREAIDEGLVSPVWYWVAVLLITCLVGCDQPGKPATRDDGKQDNGRLYRVKFDGHSYIRFSAGHRGGICHDPDCECLTK